jgi:hypothetical protein
MSDDALELPILGVTPKSSLLVQKVTGLNPPDRNLFIGEYSQDGGLYQGRRVGNRNVVFTINLNPNPALGETVSGLRQKLYKAFIDPQVDGDYLKVLLHDETNKEKYIVGYCEKFETEIFDVEPICQISMICPDPYLRDNEETILTLPEPSGWTSLPFNYAGTAETGFIARIYVTANTHDITFSINNNTMKLNLHDDANSSVGYKVGDLIIINTNRGQRSITLTKPADITSTPTEFAPPASYAVDDLVYYRGGIWKCVSTFLGVGTTAKQAPGNNNDYWDPISTPIVSHLNPRSQWLELHGTLNNMQIYRGDDVDDYVASVKYIAYTAAFWGV